jgi:hypothetical protein
MPDLSFRVAQVSAVPYAAVPTVAARLQITNAIANESVQSISLNCQVQVQPLSRTYTALEEARLLDLFGERERWARTMNPMLWVNTVVRVPPFVCQTAVDLLLPCSLDFDVAANKFFYGLEAGNIGIAVMFSGTVFYTGADGAMQIAQIPWDREANFQLPVEVWRSAVNAHYGGSVWLRLPNAAFDRLYRYKVARGIPHWETAINRLLDEAERTDLDKTGDELAAAEAAL